MKNFKKEFFIEMNNQYYNLRVLREGLITTIQDNGFINLQHLGIPTGGAIDDFSYKLGNIILSNKSNTPSIEFAKLGPKFLVEHGSLNIAITGNVNFLLKLWFCGKKERSFPIWKTPFKPLVISDSGTRGKLF